MSGQLRLSEAGDELGFRSIVALVFRLAKEHLLPYWRRLLASLVVILGMAGATAAVAHVMGMVTADLFDNKNELSIPLLGLMIIASFLARGIFRYISFALADNIRRQLELDMTERFFLKLVALDIPFFDQNSTGFIYNRFSLSCRAGANLLVQLFQNRLRELSVIIVMLGYMFYLDWIATIGVALLFPIGGIFITLIAKKIRRIAAQGLILGDAHFSQVSQAIEAIRSIKAHNREGAVKDNARDLRKRMNRLSRRSEYLSNALRPLNEAMAGSAIAAVIAYGAMKVDMGLATGEELLQFVFALVAASDPLIRIARDSMDVSSQSVMIKDYYTILDWPGTMDNRPHLPTDSSDKPSLSFFGVNFRYETSSLPILTDITFEACPGEITAIVGPSGSGKSTVFNLILRFYEPQQGVISFGGYAVKDYSRHSLRGATAYLSQAPYIFADTIRNNILMGRPDASEEEVIEACKKAHAYDFIMAMPDGFDTFLDSAGEIMSGGQRQRISIARAFLQRAPLVLLDEPTTGLDNETSALITSVIKELAERSTVLVIAHSYSTIEKADKVIVIEQGRIIEQGTPELLSQQSQRFQRLFQLGNCTTLQGVDL